MFGRAEQAAQQWSLHAEVVISHHGADDATVPGSGTTRTEQDDRGVRMVYSWHAHPQHKQRTSQQSTAPTGLRVPQESTPSNVRIPYEHSPSSSGSNIGQRQSSKPPTGNAYGFQKGNILFTSTPPDKRQQQHNPYVWDGGPSNVQTAADPNRLGINIQDSGYNSEQQLPSPSSGTTGSLPRRPIQPYDRRCRSTCSIVLSTDFRTEPDGTTRYTVTGEPFHSANCNRTQSLRCQTPTGKYEKNTGSFYGCGDPWCYHRNQDASQRFSPVQETCEECNPSVAGSARRASRAHTFSTHFCTRLPERNRSSLPDFRNQKDVASQTLETKEKCTSPLETMPSVLGFPKSGARQKCGDPPPKKKLSSGSTESKRKIKKYNGKHKTEPALGTISGHLSADSGANSAKLTRHSRSPARVKGKSPLLQKSLKSTDLISEKDRKPRTVHIDVYCTGSDADSDSSGSASDNDKSTSTPQTVYENDQIRLVHQRADDKDLPLSFLERSQLYAPSSSSNADSDIKLIPTESLERIPSLCSENDEYLSSNYPSQMSSYSAIRDFESSLSSVPMSWSAISSSSCTVPEGYESSIATSWKDTTSDFESLLHSGISLAQANSTKCISVPKNDSFQSSEGILSSRNSRYSGSSIQQSDSFEYENSADKLRIKRMEEMWRRNDNSKMWKSPAAERKHLLQRQKINEYLERRLTEKSLPKWTKPESRESESEETEDDSEQGWSFVRDSSKERPFGSSLKRDDTVRRASKEVIEEPQPVKSKPESGKVPLMRKLFGPKSPSEPPEIKPKNSPFKFSSTRGSNELLLKAEKFGTIVSSYRNLIRHAGPAKNPDCVCETCRRFYDNDGYRVRTRSVGDVPDGSSINWREQLISSEQDQVEPTLQLYTDY